MADNIALQEFIDGYKTIDVELGDRGVWKFREPTIKQLSEPVDTLLPNMIVEGDKEEFFAIY